MGEHIGKITNLIILEGHNLKSLYRLRQNSADNTVF